MNNIPLISDKEESILSLLRDQSELYARQIVELSTALINDENVYHLLYELEEDGYITSKLEKPKVDSVGPPRQLYKISASGLNSLESWYEYQLFLIGSFA
jgi:DNA-binding PadR family transcriptional regulator